MSLPAIVKALEIGLDAVRAELAERKQALAGYPQKWAHLEREVAQIEAALREATTEASVAADEVLVALKRVEGYEDVHPSILADDALMGHWPEWRLVKSFPDASPWRPIAEAPTDGTEVWAYNGEQGRMVWVSGEEYALWVWADELLSDVDPNPEQPTFFIPLPPVPAEATSENSKPV